MSEAIADGPYSQDSSDITANLDLGLENVPRLTLVRHGQFTTSDTNQWLPRQRDWTPEEQEATLRHSEHIEKLGELLLADKKFIPPFIPRSLRHVLELMSLGFTEMEAANERKVALKTIKAQNNVIFQRLEAVNMGHAVRIAFDLGILPNSNNANVSLPELTDTERRVLNLSSLGLNYPEVGRILSVSPRTAKNNRLRVYEKFGVHKLPHAVRVGVETAHLPVSVVR